MAFIESKASVSRPLRPTTCGSKLADGGDEAARRGTSTPRSWTLVAVDVEHEHDDVLADVVDVAVDRADHDRAAPALAGAAALRRGFTSAAMPFMISPPMMSSGMKASPHSKRCAEDAHRLLGLVEHGGRVGARVELAPDDGQSLVFAHADDGVGQLASTSVLLTFAHRVEVMEGDLATGRDDEEALVPGTLEEGVDQRRGAGDLLVGQDRTAGGGPAA